MIVFGSAITDADAYRQFAEPGIELAKEPDSVVLPLMATGSIFRSYNLVLEQAAGIEGLEALVLLHQDAEIVDPDFCPKVREALRDPDVGVVGCIGAIGVRSIAWWEGSVTWASFTHRYHEMGGGDLPAFSWGHEPLPAYAKTGEVDTVDGFLMVLSPWVVRNIRFDESLGQLHGYDLDFCLQVREAGRKVMTADLRLVHNHSLELVSDPSAWVEAHARIADKWEGRMPNIGSGAGDWKLRARRAEAEAELTRTQIVSRQLQHDARLAELEAKVREMEESIGWRITEPLRRANALRRRLLERRARRDGSAG